MNNSEAKSPTHQMANVIYPERLFQMPDMGSFDLQAAGKSPAYQGQIRSREPCREVMRRKKKNMDRKRSGECAVETFLLRSRSQVRFAGIVLPCFEDERNQPTPYTPMQKIGWCSIILLPPCRAASASVSRESGNYAGEAIRCGGSRSSPALAGCTGRLGCPGRCPAELSMGRS